MFFEGVERSVEWSNGGRYSIPTCDHTYSAHPHGQRLAPVLGVAYGLLGFEIVEREFLF